MNIFAATMKKFIAVIMLSAFALVPSVLADGGKTTDQNKPACKEKAKGECPAKKGCCPNGGSGQKTCPHAKDSPRST